MKRNYFFIIAALVLAGVLASTETGDEEKNLVIYSGRKEPLILPIAQGFEEKTGIKVTLKSGSSQELAAQLLQEKENTQADIYLATDAGWLEKVNKAGLFTAIKSSRLSSIPQSYRAKNNGWTGVSGRARVLIINTNLVPQAKRPTSVYDITKPEWKGKVAMATMSNESVVTHFSAIRTIHDDAFLQKFLEGIKQNDVKLLSGHTDVRKAVATGEFSIGFVNHYYGHLQQQESSNIEIVYTDQAEGQDGTMVNVSGAGIVKYGKNQEAAHEFIDYLLSEEVQRKFAELNFEFPLNPTVKSTNTKNPGEFKQMPVDLHTIAEKMDDTVKIIKEAGF